MKKIKLSIFILASALSAEASAIELTGWTGVGNFGTLGADGVVTLSPFAGSTQYGYVTTEGGVGGVGLGFGGETNGSVISSPVFSANAGDLLEFYFNFVTSDGAGFADYGWAKLLDSAMTEVALLFTARTTPGGDTVPGFGMPTLNATLDPLSTPIIAGGPAWSPLDGDSGECFDTGCGYTDWIKASYGIADAGDYILQMGVVNWTDTAFQTGMAFDGATIAGQNIGGENNVPEPATLALLGMGFAGMGFKRRKQSA